MTQIIGNSIGGLRDRSAKRETPQGNPGIQVFKAAQWAKFMSEYGEILTI